MRSDRFWGGIRWRFLHVVCLLFRLRYSHCVSWLFNAG